MSPYDVRSTNGYHSSVQHPQSRASSPLNCTLAAVSSNQGSTSCIRDVWSSNLRHEMSQISAVVEKYRFISLDTEFPGVVVTPLQCARGNETSSYQWKTIRSNVNMYDSPFFKTLILTFCSLKIIQLGLTFSDQYGNKPTGVCTWQFNFHFDVKYVSQSSI